MVLYYHNSNAILAELINSRNKQELIRTTRVLHAYLSDRDLTPQYQMMDNECPCSLKTFLLESSVKFQLVPPYLHQTNAAERVRCSLVYKVIVRIILNILSYFLQLDVHCFRYIGGRIYDTGKVHMNINEDCVEHFF